MSALDDKIDAAVTAQEAGDYAGALTYLRSARMLLLAMPDGQTGGSYSLRYGREEIADMIKDLQKRLAGSRGIQTTKIRRRGLGCDEDS